MNKAGVAGLIGSGKLKGPKGRKYWLQMRCRFWKRSRQFLIPSESYKMGCFLIRLKLERPHPG